jgi:ABC-type multidrug transport system ATPase subunit
VAFDPGEFIGVLGPSGCGKSTLLRTLAGLQARSGGDVTVDGVAVEALSADVKSRIGFVPQDDIVHGPLTVERALYFSARLRSIPDAEIAPRIDEVITQLGLVERRTTRIDKLSGGQRKRVSIGVELLTRPFLVFLDEPTSGLDPALEEQFMDLCRDLARSSRTVIMSTHVMQSLDRLDSVVIMLTGWIQWIGPPLLAQTYFGVAHLHDVYKALAKQDPKAGWEKYRNSQYYNQFVAARMKT